MSHLPGFWSVCSTVITRTCLAHYLSRFPRSGPAKEFCHPPRRYRDRAGYPLCSGSSSSWPTGRRHINRRRFPKIETPPSDVMHATTLLPPSTLSEHDPFDERRGAIYLPDGLAAKLLSVCDAAAGLEPSEPNSQIHSDLDDLWSSILASPASPIDSSNTKAEEAIQRFAERYGLVHCFPSGNLSWLDKTGNTKPASADLYKDLLEAAFGKQSGGSVYEREYRDNTLKIAISYPNVSSFLRIWALTFSGFASRQHRSLRAVDLC